MRGLILYCQKDYQKNKEFADWITLELQKHQVSTDILLIEEIQKANLVEKQYDFVINRSRSYNLSLLFELNRIPVFNPSQITLLGNNKLAAYAYAQQKGYPFAEVVLPVRERPEVIISKPIDGHGGEGIRLLKSGTKWLDNNVNQLYLDNIIGDIRFYILENKVYCAVLRKAVNGVLANFSQGGMIEYYSYSQEEANYVEALIQGLEVTYAGIDFLLTEDGQLIFNEMEDAVGSRMLSKLGENTIVPLWLENIVSKIKAARR